MQEQEPNLASRSAAHSAVAEVWLPKRLHLPLRRHELNLHMPRVLKRRQLSGLHHPVLPRKRAKIRQPLPTVMTKFASYLLELIWEHKNGIKHYEHGLTLATPNTHFVDLTRERFLLLLSACGLRISDAAVDDGDKDKYSLNYARAKET